MNKATLLNRLVEVGPPIINAFSKPGMPHCVLASTVGQMALAELGIPAEPYPVIVTVVNAAWLSWRDDGYPGGIEEQQRRGAYMLSNTPNFSGQSFTRLDIDKPWDGHLVLRVRGRKPWLVDLDLGSFNRPQQSIHLPGGVAAPLQEDGTVSGVFSATDGVQTALEYGPLDAPYRDDYQRAKDWTERARLVGHVRDLVRAVRG